MSPARNTAASRRCAIYFGCLAGVTIPFAFAEIAKPAKQPAIQKLRYEEDYSYLRNRPRNRWPQRWKFIPLDSAAGRYLTLGGEIRQRYEFTEDPQFGEDPQDTRGVWLQRYSIFGDLHFSPSLRFFGQLTSALETGRAGGPGPTDENELEWQNAFVDIGSGSPQATRYTLRLGRQEVVLGSGRLVDVREGPNVRRTFDGLRGFIRTPSWRMDAMALHPRRDRPGIFDDKTNDELGLWGLYATSGEALLPRGRLDLFYLGYENESALYTQGIAHEDRQSAGARYWGEEGNWKWNWEALYQFGRFGNGDIRAWTLASETAYQWKNRCWDPQLRIGANIASGDGDPDDPDLGTFNPLFPRGNYFSEAAVLGPRNFYNFHVFLDLQPREDWTITTDINFFWRLESEDGIYSPSGQIVRNPNDSREHYVGTALSINSGYTIRRGLVFTAIYTLLKPGSFIRDTGPSEDIDFAELTLQYRF